MSFFVPSPHTQWSDPAAAELPGRPRLLPQTSVPRAIIKLACMAGLVVFAMAELDVPVAQWVHNHPLSVASEILLRVMRLPGFLWFTVVLAFALAWRRQCTPRAAVVLVLICIAASSVTAIIKPLAGRIRPYHGYGAFDFHRVLYHVADLFYTADLSFPSGDATLAFATAGVFAAICPRWRWTGYAWATLVAVTRVLQGAHYVSDVATGALIGLATAEVGVRYFLHVPQQELHTV